jgi:hypothetical protein
LVLEVAGAKPRDLADLWRRVWRLGNPAVEVQLKLQRKTAQADARLVSADRNDFLKKPHLH